MNGIPYRPDVPKSYVHRVEAIRYDGTEASHKLVERFVGRKLECDWGDKLPRDNPVWLYLTAEAEERHDPSVMPGDWVVRHADGSIESVKDEDFRKTYVDESVPSRGGGR